MDVDSGTDFFLQIGSNRLHYRFWDHQADKTVLLLHGALANEVWWRPVASMLSANVIAIDLFGHGQSDWLESYSLTDHAMSVASVCHALDLVPDVIIGHSYGGAVAAYLQHGMSTQHLVLLDTPLSIVLYNQSQTVKQYKRPFYLSKTEAISHFRPIPAQPIIEQGLFEQIAALSLVHSPDGWSWQFDPKLSQRQFTAEEIEKVKLGAKGGLYWYGEHSPFAIDQTFQIASELAMQTVMIKQAYHAVLIDQPKILSDMINAL
ncbi:alpha/beta hydrolase [Gammaproteobacteria bacterium]|nr:alpha/beta hydrolase [Gammaproteobacteria bacterium]